MPLRKPEDFVAGGSKVFRKAPVNLESMRGWVLISRDKAKDALNQDNSTSTRLGAAYDSVLNLSLAVLSSRGWRCTAADGHHVQALEAACSYIGVTQSVFDQMDAVRVCATVNTMACLPAKATWRLRWHACSAWFLP
ncbi:hypothetical protein [Pigmentiphaga humi]|uniref:hypothetical protein n=1 Tax=Pigmentiphaga humi TaxID=2478468 RepID=UPI000F545552|nr:hypothetical protein [Pigmentiphaga humi]